MIKRIMCFVFAIVMVLSFFGCAAGDDKEEVDTLNINGLVVDISHDNLVKLPCSNFKECKVDNNCPNGKCLWSSSNEGYIRTVNSLEKDIFVIRWDTCDSEKCEQHCLIVNGERRYFSKGSFSVERNGIKQIKIIPNAEGCKCHPYFYQYREGDYSQFNHPTLSDRQINEAIDIHLKGRNVTIEEKQHSNGLYSKIYHCPNCEAEVYRDYLYCPKCGQKIKGW